MQECFAEQIAVAGMPQVQHLTTCTFIGKQPEYMQRNRDGDFFHLVTLVTVLDVGLDVLGSRHISFRRMSSGAETIPVKTRCQSLFAADEGLA
jgi:hypothetical protein